MDTKTKAILGISALAVIGGVGLYALKSNETSPPSPPPSSCNVASLQLSASPTTVSPGGTTVFTAVATDASGNPVSDVSVTLYEITTNTQSVPATTDSSGTVNFSVTFPSNTEPGQYTFEVEAC